jgi:F0F1-type ATP synthase assembly protein I
MSEHTDKTSSVKHESSRKDPAVGVKLTLAMSAASATLRVAVPILGLFAIGLTIDSLLQQKATWAIVGIIVGSILAVYLIYRQIVSLKKQTAVKKPSAKTKKRDTTKEDA